MRNTNVARRKFYGSLFRLVWEELKTLNPGKIHSLATVGLRYLLMRWALYTNDRPL
jgi:hypothetical protein